MLLGMSGRPRSFDPDRVLQQAMHAFWKRGFEATAIGDLEAATGLKRQSLYGAFGDKRALFEQVVEFYFDHVLKPGLVDVLDAPGSALANLNRVFDQWEALALSPEFNGCLVGNAAADLRAHDDDMAALLRQKLTMLENAFARALRRALRAGEVASTLDVRATARSLITTTQGLAVLARVNADRAFVRDVIASARRLLQ